MKFFEYIIYIVFDYFDRKDSKLARTHTINFLVLLEASAVVPLFIIFNLIFRISDSLKNPNDNLKYYIGIPLALGLMILNSIVLKHKLTRDKLQDFKSKIAIKNKKLVWLIFITPIIFVFVIPIIYGALNGTLKIIGI
ncbi:MAG: hypothetical protein AB9888_11770 [Bacteroidales bacterium]